MNQQNKQQKNIVQKWNEFCKMEEESSAKKRKMMEEITKVMSKKDEEIGKLRKENRVLKLKIAKMEADLKADKLGKENRALKLKIAKMEADLKAQNISIRRIMPVELINELLASMPLENSFGLLAKMPNGLLAKNVKKMINSIKEEMKNNKLNKEDCGSKITLSEEGLNPIHFGPLGYNSVRAIMPIPSTNLKAIIKPKVVFYFEMKILAGEVYLYIGFCDKQFPLEDAIYGWKNNSIVIDEYAGIWIDDKLAKFENNFTEGFYADDIVGLGIIHRPNSKMECFATLNGKLLGKGVLPPKFANIELFPVISLYGYEELIRLNFGKEEWQFKEFERVLK